MQNKYSYADLAPQKLTKEEKENPLLIFYQLFDYAALPQVREHLWTWLRITVTNGYTKNYISYRDRDSILTLYEHLEKLIEASYLIYTDRKEELRRLHHNIMNAGSEQLQTTTADQTSSE